MEGENSWLTRTKLSNTIYVRLDPSRVDSSRVPVMPLGEDVEKKLRRFDGPARSVTMPGNHEEDGACSAGIKHSASLPADRPSLHLDRNAVMKQKRASLEIPPSPPARSDKGGSSMPRSLVKSPSSLMLMGYLAELQLEQQSRRRKEGGHEPKLQASSPLAATGPSDVFREARAIGRRCATPPPTRRGSETAALSPPTGHRPERHSPPAGSRKQKLRGLKGRYFDSGGRRVSAVVETAADRRAQRASMTQAVRTTVDWTLDPKKMLVGERFACGAHSRLYRGFYDDQPVAIKFIRQPDDDENGQMAALLEKQYKSEINFLSHLYHKNVIKLVAAYECPPVFYIVTEFLSGGSLRSFLNGGGEHRCVPPERLVAIALDVARGMEYVHSQGVVHRDLKPENILFDEHSCAKIADFGIACEEAVCDVLAEDAGTYRWMAPEMIKRKAYGRKVDVYSFGLLLWEMASGHIPYEGMTPVQVAFAVVDKNLRPAILAGCPAALRGLMEQCWALKPEKRPDFWEIVRALEQFEAVLAQGGSLDTLKISTCQEHKKRFQHWIQKLRLSNS